MEEDYYVGSYWLARREDADSCAQRTERLLRELASCDPRFSRWFEKAMTLEEALAFRLEPDATRIAQVFREQEHREGRFKEEGFSLRLWSGQTHEEASDLSLLCGDASVWVSNRCLLGPPQTGAAAEHLLQASLLMGVMGVMARAWDPEWGVATSSAHRDLMTESPGAGTFVGWITYFSRSRGPLPPLPEPVRVEPVDDLGSLVLLTPERLTASNPAHVALAREVAARLSAAGLLHDLRPCDALQHKEPES